MHLEGLLVNKIFWGMLCTPLRGNNLLRRYSVFRRYSEIFDFRYSESFGDIQFFGDIQIFRYCILFRLSKRLGSILKGWSFDPSFKVHEWQYKHCGVSSHLKQKILTKSTDKGFLIGLLTTNSAIHCDSLTLTETFWHHYT